MLSTVSLRQLHEYQLYSSAPKIHCVPMSSNRGSNNISWIPPLRGTLKINVDAHLSSDGHWFTRLVLRRLNGSAVGVATRAHSGSLEIIDGEARALNDALDWVEKLGKRCVVFESDSQTIVKAIQMKLPGRRSWGLVVQRFRSYLEDNPLAGISWVKREANQVAHELARWAEVEPNRDCVCSFPSCIGPLIQKDKSLVNVG